MTLQDDLKAIEERAKAATKGPWAVDRYSNDTIRWMGPSTAALAADARFIAAARTDVPALVEMVRELLKQIEWVDMSDWSEDQCNKRTDEIWAEAKRKAGG